MKTIVQSLLIAAACFPASSSVQAQGIPGADPCPDPELSVQPIPGGKLLVRWHAASGTTQLYWAGALGDAATWQPITGAVPLPGGYWEAEFLANPARAFFQVQPAVTPVPPPNVRLVMVGDHFRLEWDSTCDASGYSVYVGLSPDVGPGNFLQRLPLPLANALEITGLTAGQTYYITIAATNAAGEGMPAPVLSGVYGPKGIFTGRAVQSFSLPSGEVFEVEAEGAKLQLMSPAQPAAGGLHATADEQGQFRIRDVPPGTYLVSWFWNGQAGNLPAPLTMTAEGVLRSPLVLPSGPQPSPPGTTLLGTLTLSTGNAPRIDVPEFQLHAQAELRADFADGSSRTVIPDRHGAWALPEITGGFPVQLTGIYQDQVVSVTVTAPPQVLEPLRLQFPLLLPKLQRFTMMQNGHEVMEIAQGVPVTFVAEVDNPGGTVGGADGPRWIAELNGQKFLSTEASPTFVFGGSATGGAALVEGGLVRVRYLPSRFDAADFGPINIDIAQVQPVLLGVGCWSGITGTWSPSAPDDILAAHPATVTVTHSGVFSPTVAGTALNQNGVSWFDTALDPTTVPPYLMRVDKTDCMRFLWPFEFQLPKEATFCVVPATVSTLAQTNAVTLVVTHLSGMELSIPYGSLLTPTSTPWTGNIIVKMVAWDPFVRSPLPPGAETRGTGYRRGIFAYSGVWFDITTATGVSLTPQSAATLTLPTPGNFTVTTMPCHHQVETTGYFERWGSPNDAVKVGPGRYRTALGGKGTFLLAFENPLMEPVFEADRSLNYPFEMRIGKSIFPITVTGACTHSFGHLYMPQYYGVDAQVLDLLQGPGMHYTAPATASFSRPLEPMKKKVITSTFNTLAGVPAVLPAITGVWVRLTMANSEPKLKALPTDTTVTGITSPNQFLARHTNTAADAAAYYAKIKAPATLSLWRTLNGFPAAFGGTIAGVGYDKYTTAYYYNVGDLGFARAQTMRILTSPIDSQPDVAFAVTNYPTLEDARCKRSPIATVCMDNSKRTDQGTVTPARYTRFYVYSGTGNLLDCADLDGAGLKCVPNLCVICHGGSGYTAGGTANLGSRFLPFDIESYNFHPKYGVQKQELASMNAGVMKTLPSATIQDLITGWYGNSNPIASFAVFNAFNQSYAPTAGASSWAGQTALYTNVFKHSCRVCHISRDLGGIQFASFANLQGMGFGIGSVCSGLSMPHSQRTWGVFWGSRGSNKLSIPGVPDMPTLLGTAAGTTCRP